MQDTTTQTATTASAPATPASSYVQSLIGPDLDQTEQAPVGSVEVQQPETVETDSTDQETTTQPESTDESASQLPTVDDLIQKFAEETGLNPNDPAQGKTLKRLADKERFILKLQADNASLMKGVVPPTAAAATDYMTAFEKSLAEADAAPPQPAAAQPQAQPAQPQAQPAAQEPFRYGDVGDNWKTPEESLTALNEAWATNDLKKVHEIELARFRRTFDSLVLPQLAKYFDQRLNQFAQRDLGDIVPAVRESVAERQMAQSRDFALEELKNAGASDIYDLFKVEDGPPIKFDGAEFANTPLNRILTKHPEIMRIMESHQDPRAAQAKTLVSRYRLAYQMYRAERNGIEPGAARKFVEAGAQMRQRESADRARQSINAGPGATGLGERPKPKSYVQTLNNMPGEIPFSSLVG